MYGNYSKHHANQAYNIDFMRHFQGKDLMYRVALIDLLNGYLSILKCGIDCWHEWQTFHVGVRIILI